MDDLTPVSIYTDGSLPLFSLTTILVLLAVLLPSVSLVGHWLGRHQLAAAPSERHESLARSGDTTLGALLALLGLLLAFSFGNALSWAEARKQAMVEEANALGTAFLRADLLAEPGREALQRALLDYGRTRVATSGDFASEEAAGAFLTRTFAAQAKLWPTMLEATADPLPAPLRAFVAGAVNDVIDAGAVRLAVQNRPATEITGVTLLITALTGLFFVGNRSALNGRALPWRTFAFAGLLWVVMGTIADLQRPQEGWVPANDSVLRAAILDMEAALRSGPQD